MMDSDALEALRIRIERRISEQDLKKSDLAKQAGLKDWEISRLLSANASISEDRRKNGLRHLADVLGIETHELAKLSDQELLLIDSLRRPVIASIEITTINSKLKQLVSDAVADSIEGERLAYFGGGQANQLIEASIIDLLSKGWDIRRLMPRASSWRMMQDVVNKIGCEPCSYQLWEIGSLPDGFGFLVVPRKPILAMWFGNEVTQYHLKFDQDTDSIDALSKWLGLLCSGVAFARAYSVGTKNKRDYHRIADFDTLLFSAESSVESGDTGIALVKDGLSSTWLDQETFDRRSSMVGSSSIRNGAASAFDRMKAVHDSRRRALEEHDGAKRRHILSYESLRDFAEKGKAASNDPFTDQEYSQEERIRTLDFVRKRLLRPNYELRLVRTRAELPCIDVFPPDDHVVPTFWEVTSGHGTHRRALFIETYGSAGLPTDSRFGSSDDGAPEFRYVVTSPEVIGHFMATFEDAWSHLEADKEQTSSTIDGLIELAKAAV